MERSHLVFTDVEARRSSCASSATAMPLFSPTIASSARGCRELQRARRRPSRRRVLHGLPGCEAGCTSRHRSCSARSQLTTGRKVWSCGCAWACTPANRPSAKAPTSASTSTELRGSRRRAAAGRSWSRSGPATSSTRRTSSRISATTSCRASESRSASISSTSRASSRRSPLSTARRGFRGVRVVLADDSVPVARGNRASPRGRRVRGGRPERHGRGPAPPRRYAQARRRAGGHPHAADANRRGLVAAKQIRERWPETGVLVLSQYVEPAYAMELLPARTPRASATCSADRVSDVDEFAAAVRRVAEGGSALDPAVVSQLVGRRRRDDPLEELTRGSARCWRQWPRAGRTRRSRRRW